MDWGCDAKVQHLSHIWDATGQLPSTQGPCSTFSITFASYIFISKWDKSAVYLLLTQNSSCLPFLYFCSFTSLCIAPNPKFFSSDVKLFSWRGRSLMGCRDLVEKKDLRTHRFMIQISINFSISTKSS